MSKACLKNIPGSVQKINSVASLIRGLPTEIALNQLTFCKKRHAVDIRKVLLSAIANADHNEGLDVDNLYVKEAWVGKSRVMKRFHARARGRGAKILKPSSHFYVTVAEKENDHGTES